MACHTRGNFCVQKYRLALVTWLSVLVVAWVVFSLGDAETTTHDQSAERFRSSVVQCLPLLENRVAYIPETFSATPFQHLTVCTSKVGRLGWMRLRFRLLSSGMLIARSCAITPTPGPLAPPADSPLLPGKELRVIVRATSPHTVVSATQTWMHAFGLSLDAMHLGGTTIDALGGQP